MQPDRQQCAQEYLLVSIAEITFQRKTSKTRSHSRLHLRYLILQSCQISRGDNNYQQQPD